jgi:starch synthase (maltosyl-transferring)
LFSISVFEILQQHLNTRTMHNGKKRVVISNVSPLIEGGKYPVKRATGEYLTVSADIFCDGHDTIAASVLIKHKKDETWREYPMTHILNDRWEATLRLEELGFHAYQLIGWVDHFTTWKKGLIKKSDANQNIAVDLEIGAQMLLDYLAFSEPEEKLKMQEWVSILNDHEQVEHALLLAVSKELSQAMSKVRDNDLVTAFPQTLEIEVERRKAGFSAWYELFPRSAAEDINKHGTFRDVIKILPRVAQMGFDTLYFPPIHPIGQEKRKGKNNSLSPSPTDPGSPWAIGNKTGGHKAIHPELGTIADFTDLVKEAQKLNIEIAMDIAYQCAPDHPYVKEHPQWFKWRPDGSVQYAENPPKRYEDILPFDFETNDWENLWQELKSVIDYWIDMGVRVFRIDNPHTKSFSFWEWMIREVRLEHPEIIFLAEAFTRPRVMEKLAKLGFNQSYTYFTWRNSKWEFEQYLNELTKTDQQYYFRPNFWANTPDILPHHLAEGGENAHIMRLILAATMSSNYGIYGPVYEFGINTPHPGKEEYTDNEKYEIKHWDWNRYSRTAEIITLVNKIRNENAALQTTWNIDFTETDNEQIICYTKTDFEASTALIIAVNLDAFHTQGAYIRVPLEKLGIGYGQPFQVRDMLSGEKYNWLGEYNYVQLNPYDMPAHILEVQQTI